MNAVQILSVLSALAAALWAVLTRSEEHEKRRQLKRDQDSAIGESFILSRRGVARNVMQPSEAGAVMRALCSRTFFMLIVLITMRITV